MHPIARDEFVNVDGLRLHYLDWGGTAGRVLVLVHGLTSNAHAWTPFIEQGYVSREKFRILCLDQRGHGDSDHARDYSVHRFASDLHAFAATLGLDAYDLMGHSLGARHAMAYAGDHWRSLRKLVLIDFGPEMARSGAVEVKARTTERPAGFSSLDRALLFLKEMNPDRTEDELRHNARHALRLNYARRHVWKHDPELQWISGAFGVTEVPHLWAQVAKIGCPTLIVRGETSNVLDRETVARMLDVMPAGEAVEIAGASHAVPQDRPVEFWSRVNAWLE
jgi:pimeloyl-ACP methyl ester carboxylesterase